MEAAPTDFESNPSTWLRKSVWLVREKKLVKEKSAVREKSAADRSSYGSAFSVDKGGLLLTCYHVIRNNLDNIWVRRLDKTGPFLKAVVIYLKREWDLALLKVKVDDNDCQPITLADDGSLIQNQVVMHMGNPVYLVASFTHGKVVFPCINAVTLPEGDDLCHNHKSEMKQTPQYRVLGDLVNKQMYAVGWLDYFAYCHPQVPIIHMHGLGAVEGSSGGPVCNLKGEAVGMVLAGIDNFDFAIHVTLLREFLRLFKECKEGEIQG